MDLNLKDQVAVITGGSVGIGLAVAKGLAEEGVHLVLCARNQERVLREAKQIAENYYSAMKFIISQFILQVIQFGLLRCLRNILYRIFQSELNRPKLHRNLLTDPTMLQLLQ